MSKHDKTANATATAEHGQIGHPDLVAHRQRLSPEIITVRPKVHCIFGVSLANCHVIEGDTGLIIIDTGHSHAEGLILREYIEKISALPVAAVLYTHNHYTRGTAALIDDPNTTIIGHQRLHANTENQQRTAAYARKQRVIWETGKNLPAIGPDAVIAPAPYLYGESGYLPVTSPATPGDRLNIAGVTIDVLPGDFDTDDGLSFYFPDYKTAAHNLVVAQLPNFGSLAGGRYRDPLPWLDAVQHLRQFSTEHLLPCHGKPLSGYEEVQKRLDLNFEAVSAVYQDTMDALSAGKTVPDVIRDIHLPDHLQNNPELRQLYGDLRHMIAGFAHGEMGFWSGEPRDLEPLHPDAEAHALQKLVGSGEALMKKAEEAVADCLKGTESAAWALHLSDAAVRLDLPKAHQLRAQILRHLGHRSSAWTLRNTLLSLAHADEQATKI